MCLRDEQNAVLVVGEAIVEVDAGWGVQDAHHLAEGPLAILGALTPTWAAGAMAASSVSVVANALRLRRYRRNDRRRIEVQPVGTSGIAVPTS
jgi:hypothetical protein